MIRSNVYMESMIQLLTLILGGCFLQRRCVPLSNCTDNATSFATQGSYSYTQTTPNSMQVNSLSQDRSIVSLSLQLSPRLYENSLLPFPLLIDFPHHNGVPLTSSILLFQLLNLSRLFR